MSRGELFLCGTPIGNLEDITIRARNILQQVDLIAAEDTRHTRKLLAYYEINTPLTSYHQHNEKQKTEKLLSLLCEGKDIALVSDAGMPGISDPGEYLVKRAAEQGIRVYPVPGPSALIAALAVSGLSTMAFVFEGFLPRKGIERRRKLSRLTGELRTMIFYEAPHRIVATLQDMKKEWGPRQITICRELTKQYEEIRRGSIVELLEHFQQVEPKGEFCLVVQGTPEKQEEVISEAEILVEAVELQRLGWSTKEVASEMASRYGLPKRQVYNLLVKQDKG